MEHRERVDAVMRELGALNAAVAAGPITAPVPTCPDWTMGDLASHVGSFCGFWTHVLCEGTGRDKTPFPDPPEGEAVGPWLVELGDHLVDLLQVTPAEAPVWTWFEPDQTAGFVARRCANELAVHRYDAQAGRGASEPIEPTLAADCIDELFGALVTVRRRTGRASGQTMHIHGTDEGVTAEWLVTLQPDSIEVEPSHAKGDLALRGSTSDLALLLFSRPTLAAVERFGDEAVLDLWYGEFNL